MSGDATRPEAADPHSGTAVGPPAHRELIAISLAVIGRLKGKTSSPECSGGVPQACPMGQEAAELRGPPTISARSMSGRHARTDIRSEAKSR